MKCANSTEEELNASPDTKRIFLWYYDKYLPAAAGNTYYGKNIRYYQTYTSEVTFEKNTSTACTLAAEGFGYLLYDNGLEKWRRYFADPKAAAAAAKNATESRGKYTQLPKNETEKVQALCGFNRAGQEKLLDLIQTLKKQRDEDAENGDAHANLALKVLKEAQEIPEDVTAPVKNGKSRKRKADTPEPDDFFCPELFEV